MLLETYMLYVRSREGGGSGISYFAIFIETIFEKLVPWIYFINADQLNQFTNSGTDRY